MSNKLKKNKKSYTMPMRAGMYDFFDLKNRLPKTASEPYQSVSTDIVSENLYIVSSFKGLFGFKTDDSVFFLEVTVKFGRL